MKYKFDLILLKYKKYVNEFKITKTHIFLLDFYPPLSIKGNFF